MIDITFDEIFYCKYESAPQHVFFLLLCWTRRGRRIFLHYMTKNF